MAPNTAFTKGVLKGDKGDAGDISLCWPVGSVFIGTVATDPSTLLGFGTWSSIGAGRVLVGLDSGDTDFDTLGETGGAKTVQSSAQTFAGDLGTTSAANTGATKIGSTNSTATLKAHTHTLTPSGTNTPGSATSVVQPYLVVRFWERTA
jgi:hypothetical protein